MNKKTLFTAIIVLIIDQLSKSIVVEVLTLNKPVSIIPKFFSLTLCQNTGTAFGILSNARPLIITCTIIAIILIYHFIYCFKNNTRNNIAFGLLYGGLAGNLIDRTILGYVIDFLDFYIGKFDYPVFNIADIAIVIGVILLIYATLKGEEVNEDRSNKRQRKTRQISSK